MEGVGRAFGKLILFGEHAAVYGHPAVGITLPQWTEVSLEDPGAADWDLRLVSEEDRETVRRVLARVEASLPALAAAGRCTVQIQSSVPRKGGFGSSAALCGAFARAALGRAGEAADDLPRAWAIAHDAERLFHGTPSGVDTGLALLGGTCVLRPRPPGLPEHRMIPRRGIALVVGAVQRDAACAALVGGLAGRMSSGDTAVREAIGELGALADRAAVVLQAGASDAAAGLGSLADQAMNALRGIGLSTPDLEVVLEAARRAGALGAKLSGAGGGGAFYAIAPDARAAAVIAEGIREAAASAGLSLLSDVRVVTA
jgi:mevalonate kinase